MSRVIISNLAPIKRNDLLFFLKIEKSFREYKYETFFWSCVFVEEFNNYIEMSWDIAKWPDFSTKLSKANKKIALSSVDRTKWLPRIEKLVKQGANDINWIFERIVFNSYYVLTKYEPDIYFAWNYFCPHSGIAYDICPSLGIKRYFIERGNFPDTWYLNDDGLLGHSKIASKSLEELQILGNYNEYGREYIRSLKIDKNDKYKQIEDNIIYERLTEIKNLRESSGFPIVVFLPPDDGTVGFFPVEHADRKATLPCYDNSLDAAIQLAKLKECIVIFKPHPSFIGWEYDTKGLENLVIIDYDFSYLIKISDVVATTGSGLGLIALALDKPVMSFSIDILFNKGIAYDASDKNNIASAFAAAINKENFGIRIERFYSFVGYLLCEYMIGVGREEFRSPEKFIASICRKNKSGFKRILEYVRKFI
jgi:hypothetical protein